MSDQTKEAISLKDIKSLFTFSPEDFALTSKDLGDVALDQQPPVEQTEDITPITKQAPPRPKRVKNQLSPFFDYSISDLDFHLDEFDQAGNRKKELEEQSREPKKEPPIEEEVTVSEVREETGEAQEYPYKLHLPPELATRIGEPTVDHSYSALMYLQSLGYKKFDFFANPAHTHKYDVCDALSRMSPWSLDYVLRDAESHSQLKGYPVAPLFHFAHVNCQGYVVVSPPTTIDDIPDDAPGLHMWEDESEIRREKETLLSKLAPVIVNRFTLAPNMFEKIQTMQIPSTSTVRLHEWYETLPIRKKKGSQWNHNVKPVKVKTTLFIRDKLGLVQLLNKDMVGLETESYNQISKVFFPSLEINVTVPISGIESLPLKIALSGDAKEGSFVLIEDEDLGISLGQVGENLYVYDPSFDMIVETDDWQLLETA
jgi:hypothetical protein